MDWNSFEVGPRPDHESIIRMGRKHQKASPNQDRLRNWYPPECGRVPIESARLVCQRANLVWDSNLRAEFSHWLLAIPLFAGIVSFVFGLMLKWSLESFVLSAIIPLLPWILRLLREREKHLRVAADKQYLRQHVEELLAKASEGRLSKAEAATESRKLQDRLFDSRKSSILIPEWFYRKHREHLEGEMREATRKLIIDFERNPLK